MSGSKSCPAGARRTQSHYISFMKGHGLPCCCLQGFCLRRFANPASDVCQVPCGRRLELNNTSPSIQACLRHSVSAPSLLAAGPLDLRPTAFHSLAPLLCLYFSFFVLPGTNSHRLASGAHIVAKRWQNRGTFEFRHVLVPIP